MTLRRETRGLVSESNVGDAGHRVDDFDLKLLPLGIHAHAVYSCLHHPSLLRPRHSAESSARPSWSAQRLLGTWLRLVLIEAINGGNRGPRGGNLHTTSLRPSVLNQKPAHSTFLEAVSGARDTAEAELPLDNKHDFAPGTLGRLLA